MDQKMRPSWTETFMSIAGVWSKRASCPRASVGCVITLNGVQIASGYNGSPPGMPTCLEVGCRMVGGHCTRSQHAEVNALLQSGTGARGGTLYSTVRPCIRCANMIVRAGISNVVFANDYRSDDITDVREMFENLGIGFYLWLGEDRLQIMNTGEVINGS